MKNFAILNDENKITSVIVIDDADVNNNGGDFSVEAENFVKQSLKINNYSHIFFNIKRKLSKKIKNIILSKNLKFIVFILSKKEINKNIDNYYKTQPTFARAVRSGRVQVPKFTESGEIVYKTHTPEVQSRDAHIQRRQQIHQVKTEETPEQKTVESE